MRSMFIASLVLAASTSSLAQNLQVFDVRIEINESCTVTLHQKGRPAETLKSPFSTEGICRILSHSETNVPRIEFIQGEYVLLVESTVTTDGACRAKLAAITVARSGGVRWSKPTTQTSACGSAERKDFEILRNQSRQ